MYFRYRGSGSCLWRQKTPQTPFPLLVYYLLLLLLPPLTRLSSRSGLAGWYGELATTTDSALVAPLLRLTASSISPRQLATSFSFGKAHSTLYLLATAAAAVASSRQETSYLVAWSYSTQPTSVELSHLSLSTLHFLAGYIRPSPSSTFEALPFPHTPRLPIYYNIAREGIQERSEE